MKQKKLYILFLIIFLSLIEYTKVFSADEDIKSYIIIKNIEKPSPEALEFDITIKRKSNDWIKFINSTFSFDFDDENFVLDENTIDIEFLSSELPENTSTGGILPENGYFIDWQLYNNRMSFTFLGPPAFDDCVYVPTDTTLLLGRFRLTSKDNKNVPYYFHWLSPYRHYQACAFKIENDSTHLSYIRYYTEDNVPMIDGSEKNGVRVKFQIYDIERYKFVLDYFRVEYTGQRNISIFTRTRSEFNNRGFTILRTPNLTGGSDSPFERDNAIIDTVYTYLPSQYHTDELISQGNSRNGFLYPDLVDKVNFRGGDYCYRLYAELYGELGKRDTLLAEDCTFVPALLIASAVPTINPFSVQTEVLYELLDDAYIKIEVWDMIGKFVGLLENPSTKMKFDGTTILKRGKHRVTFSGEGLSNQGLYNVVIRGIPLDNNSAIEKGVAVVKFQLIR